MATTSIEWTDRVWNPVTGCTKVSPGCKHCYAETIADRFWSTQYKPVLDHTRQGVLERARRFTDIQCHADRLAEPGSWRKPSRVFVNSMSDLFHDEVPGAFIEQVFAAMVATPRHTYQILTKRADNMRRFMVAWQQRHGSVPPNVWLGVSVENQEHGDERIPLLLQAPAAVRFLSCEPLLGPLRLFAPEGPVGATAAGARLDWVIVGGESGRGARPFDVAWARALINQCREAGVACFVKQLGAKSIAGDERVVLTNRKGGAPDEWPADLRVREFPLRGGQ
jgi:protein gp37